MNDPDETSPEERPADETSREEPSAPDGDRELSADGPGTEEKRQSATPETDFNWSPHPSVSELPEVGDDTNPFYGRIRDRLLGNRPFQFSLATMFWITAAVAIVFSSARASGVGFAESFAEMFFVVYVPLYVCGPAVIVLTACCWAKTAEGRFLVGAATAGVILAPAVVLAGVAAIAVIPGTACLWGIEALVIAAIWRGFHPSRRNTGQKR